MICVYGLNELVDAATTQKALFAENDGRARPLEVATFYGNLVTMRLICRTASLKPRSSIRAKEWLAAAARSRNLDIWKFALEHIEDIPFKSTIIEAVKDPKSGKEMVLSLLNDSNEIDEETYLDILSHCASFETLDVITAKSHTLKFTERMLNAAVQNPSINPELVEMILAKGENLRVSESSIIMAFRYSQSNKEAVVKALLNHDSRCEISEELVCNVARMYDIEAEVIPSLGLPTGHCSINHTTEDWLMAAATNESLAFAVLKFFLERSDTATISQQVLQSVLANSLSAKNLNILFPRLNCPSILEESLYIAAEQSRYLYALLVGIGHGESLCITDAFLQACATKSSLSEMKSVISTPRAVSISREVVCASLKGGFDAADKLDLLLRHKAGFELGPSEDILLQPVSNVFYKLELVRVLANHWTSLPVTEASMIASVSCEWDGTQVFDFLLQFCESVETGLTGNVLLAAIQGTNIEFVEHFRKEKPNFEVKEEYLIAAIRVRGTNMAVLRVLLSQLSSSPISRFVLEEVARTGDRSMFELMLEQPGAPGPSPFTFDLAKGSTLQVERDEDLTFDAILSEVSEGGYSDRWELTELSTTQFDRLLGKYRGPKMNKSLLVEAAAKREDGKFVLQHFLSCHPDTVVTRGALLAAASNEKALTTLLDFLLNWTSARADTELLQRAASNKYRGTPMFKLLLANLPADTEIENSVTAAALKNPYCDRSILEIILKRQPDLEVTQDLVDAAFENTVQGNYLLHVLLIHSLTQGLSSSADLILRKTSSSEHDLRDSCFIAACYGNESVLRYLVSQGAPVNAISGELGTALNVAAYANNLNAVEILLNFGSDSEACSPLYGTPLEAACKNENLVMMKTLINHGADVDREDQTGRTSLHTASRQGQCVPVGLLLSLRGSSTKRDKQGMTAIHHASTYPESAAGDEDHL
ncbi:MAG: hypothetical protein Q9191_007810, partial [Dirinaria sp. TL-2023a]